MKNFTVFLVLVIGMTSVLRADIVDPAIAAKAAENHYLSLIKETGKGNISLELAFTRTSNGLPLYYIFNVGENEGFVIISAEDNVYPLLGYAFTGRYEIQPPFDPVNFNGWMDGYAHQIISARENSFEPDDKITGAWNNLLAGSPVSRDIESVEPMLTTLWHQTIHYNELCPPDPQGPAGHCPTGCGATAMAQLMKYHNYPEQGTGSNAYYCPPFDTLYANFGETTYQWDSMPNQVLSQNLAVATLMYHVGVAINTDYTPGGESVSYFPYSKDALVKYFKYSPEVQMLVKNSYPYETFVYKLKNELNLQRPVLYFGQQIGSVGHVFVCDGYEGDDHFHFNWGWGGYANGYFYLDNLNPWGNYTEYQGGLIHVFPEDLPTLAVAENLAAEVIDGEVDLAWDAPGDTSVLGYNVYRNNILIAFTGTTQYLDPVPVPGCYTYYVCALYDAGESFGTELKTVITADSSLVVYEDSFESYTSGGKLACQNSTDWTTWSNAPCSAEDASITSQVTYTGTNAVMFDGYNDVVKKIDNYTEDIYRISFQMYLPGGSYAYYNVLQLFNGSNSRWGFQLFIDDNGYGSIDGGGLSIASFDFPHDTWMLNEITVDLDNDWAVYELGGVTIHGWKWSSGVMGEDNLDQLGGVNFWPWEGPMYYIDDFRIEKYDNPYSSVPGPGDAYTEHIEIFPNPAEDFVTLRCDFPMERVAIYNGYGQKVLEQSTGGDQCHVDVSGLSPGVYFLVIGCENGTQSRKIIKR